MTSRRIVLAYAAALLGAVALTASCRLVGSLFPSAAPPPRPFNHVAHLDRGLSCLDCHASAASESYAGMPTREACMECHEEIDAEPGRAKDATVAWFLDAEGRPVWSAFTKQSSEIVFSHQAHETAKVACATCHQGIEKDIGLVPTGPQRMSSCVDCHRRDAPSKNACADCHRELDRDVAPESHRRMWDVRHGRCSRSGGGETANDCAMCHGRDECVRCHQTEPPRDHDQWFRLRGHGTAAAVDRARCTTCHASDSCVRCHQESAPLSHTGGWTGASQRHCVSCHVPLSTTPSCLTCHKSTPGHASAPPKPGWHNPAMNCRSCHAASLPHPDNGDNCNSCHQ